MTTPEFNTLAANVFNARLAQANWITKTDFDTKFSSLNRKITSNKSKHLPVKNELKKLKEGLASFFLGNTRFRGGDGLQALIFQPIHRYFKIFSNTKYISEWKSKGLSDESIKFPTTSDNSLDPLIDYVGYKRRLEFNGSCLKQPRVTYTHGKTVNIYIVYELAGSSSHINDSTLKNCLFRAVTSTKITSTKKAYADDYGYSDYGIGFDRKSSFSFPVGDFGQTLDMSSSTKIDSRKKGILILGKGPTQGLEDTLTSEKMYLTNFTVTKKNCLSLHYNVANSYLFVNVC